MSEINVAKVNNVSPVLPAGSGPGGGAQEFVPREGQVYAAVVKGFSEGAALVSINNRFLLSLADISLKIGEQVSLKLLRREADGKLVFKLADSAADAVFTARERSAADILKSVGANLKNPQAENVLDSYLKFGMKLEARSIDRAASSLAKVISAAQSAPASGSQPAAQDIEILADGAALLTRSNIPVTAESLKLAASLINSLRSQNINYNRLFSSSHPFLASGLADIAAEQDQKNKKAASAARRVAGIISSRTAEKSGLINYLSEFFRVSPSDRPQEISLPKKTLLKDLITLAGELEKRNAAEPPETKATAGPYERAAESAASLIENRALIELYSAIAGNELFKMPFGYDGEEHEALCAVEKEDGRVIALDMYLTLSKLGPLRVNVKKKDSAAGFYIFVETAAIKEYMNEKYLQNKEFIDSALGGRYYFTLVVGKKIDFLPPFFKYVSGPEQPSEFDISV